MDLLLLILIHSEEPVSFLGSSDEAEVVVLLLCGLDLVVLVLDDQGDRGWVLQEPRLLDIQRVGLWHPCAALNPVLHLPDLIVAENNLAGVLAKVEVQEVDVQLLGFSPANGDALLFGEEAGYSEAGLKLGVLDLGLLLLLLLFTGLLLPRLHFPLPLLLIRRPLPRTELLPLLMLMRAYQLDLEITVVPELIRDGQHFLRELVQLALDLLRRLFGDAPGDA